MVRAHHVLVVVPLGLVCFLLGHVGRGRRGVHLCAKARGGRSARGSVEEGRARAQPSRLPTVSSQQLVSAPFFFFPRDEPRWRGRRADAHPLEVCPLKVPEVAGGRDDRH